MSLAVDLRSFVSTSIRERGSALYATGNVTVTAGDNEFVSADVRGSQLYDVTLRRERDKILAYCECPYFASDGICKHIWATVLAADKWRYLAGRQGRSARALLEDWEDPFIPGGSESNEDDNKLFELEPPAPPKPSRPEWKKLIGELVAPDAKRVETWRDDREIYYILQLANTQWSSTIELEVQVRERKKDGAWGKLKSARIPRDGIARMASETDREILMMLGGTPLAYDYSSRESIPANYRLEGSMAPLLLAKVCATGRCCWRKERNDTLESMPRLHWDQGPAWQFRLRLDRKENSWLVGAEFTRDEGRIGVEEPAMLFPQGLLVTSGHFARFEGPGAWAWSKLLRSKGPIPVPVTDADEFLMDMLRHPELPPVQWPQEFRYTESKPDFRPALRIESQPRRGRRDEVLCAYASFVYDGLSVSMSDKGSGIFDPVKRVLAYRDSAGEKARLEELAKLGFKLDSDVNAADAHHHLPVKKLPVCVRQLIGNGWHVEIEGRPFRKAAQYRAEVTSGVDWFELRTAVDYDGAEAQLPDLLKALQQNSNLVELSDGSMGLIPEDLIRKIGGLLATGKADGDHLRFSRSQTALLDALLAQNPEVSADETFLRAREHLRSFERIEPSLQPDGFTGTLRHYQCEGLSWMRFLQDLSFGGCLADDMGLGKTAQVLALLEQRREMREKGEEIGPSLAVVPRSLIFNWIEEARRFTPKLRVLDHSGTDRNRREFEFSDYDLVLTTYGTIRRDILKLQKISFDYAILDEAQAIKNPASDSAKSVRLIQAKHRLALSGTPIQNHLGELYSLFDFLNPGMLGSIRALSAVGLSIREPDKALCEMLAMAVRPFLLRRTKEQVAKELPARTEQTIYCELDADERKQYNQLREHYRSALLGRIEQQGIAKSQMHILEALLRLRQAACHPGLLDAKRKKESSAKLDALLAHVIEVVSEGHKALVFSQFTTFLDVVRAAIDQEGVPYEYLDGRTRDRQSRVNRFQTDKDCKLFLISLKAGGVGLNLTAADYVFLLDPWWNPAIEAQAIDRTHRIGQSNNVFAYRLISKETVEEKVLELQGRKRELADSIIRADASLVSSLKREDLEFLLS
jgi:superfamily II DNA or RNA helicase